MRQAILIAVLIGFVATFGSIAYAIATTSAGPRPSSYQAAVVRVLKASRVDYRDVEVLDGCAPSFQNCRTYAATVRVQAATTLAGHIDCRERWTTCTLSVPQAGISGAPLEDVRDPIAARWEALYGQMLLRIQELYRGTS
ncbi:MAG TPA: hypothetical protein VFU22_27660 [Roseiflexaceae bacterium]|nr:hypothetical protein [Roseiflexaceae bacterium]